MTNKNLYKGLFNWYGEVNKMYRYAYNEDKAFSLFIQALSKKYGINRNTVRIYFTGKNNHKIKKED